MNSNKLYEFGRYRLDPQKRQIWRDGKSVSLTAKAAEILAVLVDRRGEIVSKDELMEVLWPDSYVEEANLTQNVFLLRKALGETAADRNFIFTVPGKGYRFVADVRETANGNGTAQLLYPSAPALGVPATVMTAPAAAPTSTAPGRRPLPQRRWLWLALPLLLLITSTAYLGLRLARPQQQAAAGRMVLAVLPFANLTGDSAQDYFSDGLTEEMITQLGILNPQRLGVIAPSSLMPYKNSQRPVEEIGRELGAQYVLKGSVRRDSDRVRISAQMIQTKDQTYVWAREYDRKLTNLLQLEGEIAQGIASQIQLTLGEDQKERETANSILSPEEYQAYDLYLKGRYFWNKRTADGFQQATNYFQQSIAKDPRYARSYAGLADTYALMSNYGLVSHHEYMPKARAAAVRALELDEKLAEAHASLANIAEDYDFDWHTAEKEFRRAIRLNPNYATAHHWLAECLAFQGKFDEAVAESERALQLDPMSLIIASDHGVILYYARQYDQAIKQFRAVLTVEPSFARANIMALAYVQKGQFSDALAEIEDARRIDPGPSTWAYEAYVYGRSGQEAKGRHALEMMEEANRSQHRDLLPLRAMADAGMNNKDEAIGALERAYSERSNFLTTLKVDPVYDPLRRDPRFQDLMRRVGLAQ